MLMRVMLALWLAWLGFENLDANFRFGPLDLSSTVFLCCHGCCSEHVKLGQCLMPTVLRFLSEERDANFRIGPLSW